MNEIKGKRVAILVEDEYQDQEVCVDGDLITSRQPDDLPAFCAEIIDALKGRK